jgi:hypothetical protein
MEGRGCLAAGFAAIGSGRGIVLVLTAATIVVSVLAAAPIGPSLVDGLGHTLAGDHVLKNDPRFAATDVLDFFREKAPALSGVRSAARWGALLLLLQQILVAGGIVSTLGRADGFRPSEFVAGVRRNAWHNSKCFLLFLIAAGVSIGIWIGLARAVSKKAFENAPPGAGSVLGWRILTILGILFLYAVFSLLHDFARAARRYDPGVGAWRAYARARRILSGRWLRAFGLLLFWLVFGGAVLFASVWLEWIAPAVSAAAIGLHILMQGAVLAIRPVVRVAAWGSYLSFSDRAEAASAAAAPPPSVPPEPGVPPLLTLEEHPLV